METTKKVGKDDYTHINRMMFLNKLVQHYQARYGKITPARFDFLDDMAYKLAGMIPSDCLVKDAETLTVSEILGSDIVQKAELTQEKLSPIDKQALLHPIPYAEKKPKPKPHNGAMWAVFGGIVGLIATGVILLILRFFG